MAFLTKTLATKNFILLSKRYITTTQSIRAPNVAVVLSGSGVYDGSEIHEASAALVHLTRGGAVPHIFAPDVNQMHVVDHIKGEPIPNETRNILVESARIARGSIKPLNELKINQIDGLVFPGGFGVAKNLSNFAIEGPNCTVIKEVERVIREFHSAKKPIAFCCIAPILAAKVLGKVEITLGQDKDDGSGHWPHCGAVQAAVSMGAVHKNALVNECVIDQTNLLVTTPAFMYQTGNYHEIYDGIGIMIKAFLEMMK